MGKYLRKSNTKHEPTQQNSPLGVRTRAKTLALQTPSDYLQLRSRRLQKIVIGADLKRPRRQNPNFRSRLGDGSGHFGSGCVEESQKEVKDDVEGPIEGSFGENMVDFDARERGTRETTPCSFIRVPDTVGTPSSTKSANLTDGIRTTQNLVGRHIPMANDMDTFFSSAEKQQQMEFEEKYNYDPVNDKPLPGRYEWVKVDP